MPTYAPDLVIVPSRTGVNVDVNMVNASLYGRHWRPQPFTTLGIVGPELWGNFSFGPGYVSDYYREQWYLENQDHPVTYSVVAGSLPSGLVLSNLGSTAQGQIDGMPTLAGTFNFTLKAQGPSISGTKDFTIVISPGAAAGGFSGGCGS